MSCLERVKKFADSDSAVLIYTPISRYYLSGFVSSLGYLFVTENRNVLFVDGRYFEAASIGAHRDIEVVLTQNIAEQGKKLLGTAKRLVVETANTVSDVKVFEKLFGIAVEPLDELDKALAAARLIKTDYEIECITKAQRIAEVAFDYILGFIKPGVRENEIAAELEYRMKLQGSEEPSFSTIAISGKKTSMPHGVPDSRQVKSGELVTMDFGAVYEGYHSDMTRTVAVGSVDDEIRRAYDTVLNANIAGINAVAEGVLCKDVDKAARDIIEKAGFIDAFTHSTGHGVGLEIHEAPNLSYKNEADLVSGQVITIEPGVYLSGRFGIRVEDMVVVTKNGCNNLTKSPKKLIIL